MAGARYSFHVSVVVVSALSLSQHGAASDQGLGVDIVAVICYGLAWFSAGTGLTTVNQTPVMDWMALFLAFYLFGVWYGNRTPLSRNLQMRTKLRPLKGIVMLVTSAILLPVLLSFVHYKLFRFATVAGERCGADFADSRLAVLVSCFAAPCFTCA